MNERFQNALKAEAQPVPPIWMMRQAGRYHHHYQGLRAKHSFMELCKDPALAAQVALGPIEDFDFDVAILFSDLLFPLEALGMGLAYTDHGPRLSWTLSQSTLGDLRDPDAVAGELDFQRQALIATRRILPKHKSLIGFVGGPWTLFTYAVEGSHSGHLLGAKKQIPLFAEFAGRMVRLLKHNIASQLQGGAEVVMVFDTAAGEISPGIFAQIVAPWLEDLAQTFPGQLGYYARGVTGDHLRAARFAWAGMGVDHRFDLTGLLKERKQGFLQGNFDQALLFAEPQDFRRRLEEFLEPLRRLSAEQRAGWVCGLGHGVLPKTPELHVRQFVATVREVFAK